MYKPLIIVTLHTADKIHKVQLYYQQKLQCTNAVAYVNKSEFILNTENIKSLKNSRKVSRNTKKGNHAKYISKTKISQNQKDLEEKGQKIRKEHNNYYNEYYDYYC